MDEQKNKIKSKNSKLNIILLRILFYLLILLLFVIFVVPKADQIKQGLRVATKANTDWVVIAVCFLVLTYFASAFVYIVLAKSPIKYVKTVLVQIATSFANRLIPGGFGGIGLNADYLIRSKHSPSEASSVVATNSIVAIVSHLLLLIIALLIGNLSPKHLIEGRVYSIKIILIILLLLILVIYFLSKRQNMWLKFKQFIIKTWLYILDYRKNLHKLLLGLIGASLVTLFYVAILYASAHASGLHVSFVQAFVAYTAGILLGAVVLTPGGLIGVEAGLYAALVSFKFEPSVVFSTIVIFRLITFWLPIIPGYVSFLLLRKSKAI